MSSLKDNLNKFFGKKIEKQKKDKKAQETGIPTWIREMPEGADKRRALAVHKANQKNSGDNYNCGGVKYKKLKERLKKK